MDDRKRGRVMKKATQKSSTNHDTQSDYIKDPRSRKDFHPGVTMAVGEFFGDVSCFSGFWVMRLTSNGYKEVSFSEAKGLRLPNHWPPKSHEVVATYFETSNEIGRLP